jgi:hypothetical protein
VWIISCIITTFSDDGQGWSSVFLSPAFVYTLILTASAFNGLFNGPMWIVAMQ